MNSCASSTRRSAYIVRGATWFYPAPRAAEASDGDLLAQVKAPLIELDAGNVLLEHSIAYAGAWERAFAYCPIERDPTAYWPIDRWDVERLSGERLTKLRQCFDEEFGSTIPAIGGAHCACHAMTDADSELVCVSAIGPAFEVRSLRNLRRLGCPIERVIATSSATDAGNPKARAIGTLAPVAFVDDYLPYLCGIDDGVHSALVMRQPTGSSNRGPDLARARSKHQDLAGFAEWWLAD